jgi:hypothetical protein
MAASDMSIDPPLQQHVEAICDQAIREGPGTFAARQDLLQLYEVFADNVAEKPQKWLVWARLGGYAAVGQDLSIQEF